MCYRGIIGAACRRRPAAAQRRRRSGRRREEEAGHGSGSEQGHADRSAGSGP